MDRTSRRPWWKPRPWVWRLSGLYVAWLANLTLDGNGIGAAFLTYPAGIWAFGLFGPEFGETPGRRVVGVMVAGAINAVVLFFAGSVLHRLLSIRAFGELHANE
jgi:hypothetical protein